MTVPRTVAGVIDRLREIDDALPSSDGLAVFNRMYLTRYALAGMNAHIEHDLPVAVVRTCEARGLEPEDVQRDVRACRDRWDGVMLPIRARWNEPVPHPRESP